MEIYQLIFWRPIKITKDHNLEETRYLGYFSTEVEARKAMNFYMTLPEYKGYREGIKDADGYYDLCQPNLGFYIGPTPLGDLGWNTGFFTAGEEDDLEENQL